MTFDDCQKWHTKNYDAVYQSLILPIVKGFGFKIICGICDNSLDNSVWVFKIIRLKWLVTTLRFVEYQ